MINTDTKFFISISKKPSSLGTKIYGNLFQKYKINSVYKSFVISNLNSAIEAIKTLSISGFSVSMPFKEKILKKVDILDDSVKKTGSVNTVLVNNKKLIGYNTDLVGAEKAVKKIKITKKDNILICGSGGTSRTISYILRKKSNFKNVYIFSRNKKTSKKLIKNLNLLKFNHKKKYDILINCTPLGMANEKKIPFPESYIKNCKGVIDFVNNPPNTSLIKLAKKHNKKFVDGIFISLNQITKQFQIYTNKKISFSKIKNIFLNLDFQKDLKKITRNYLKYFERKDFESLKNIFAEKIKLKDWENNLKGKTKVLNFNRKIFSKVQKIVIKKQKISVSKNTVFADLKLIIDNNKLNILDVIKFNNKKKIISINAYRR